MHDQRLDVAQISVDGDTSTNDTVIGLASGAAGNPKITDLNSPEAKQLEDAVTALLQASTQSTVASRNLAPCICILALPFMSMCSMLLNGATPVKDVYSMHGLPMLPVALIICKGRVKQSWTSAGSGQISGVGWRGRNLPHGGADERGREQCGRACDLQVGRGILSREGGCVRA